MYYIKKYKAPIGEMTMISDGEFLIELSYKNQKYFNDLSHKNMQEKELPIFKETIDWLERYFDGKNPGEIPKVKFNGTEFRNEVWNILLKIPYGEITTYGEIAKTIAKRKGLCRMSAQAIGGAVGHNPISIIVPCHRVVGANGALTGYAGGIDKKINLLSMEGHLIIDDMLKR